MSDVNNASKRGDLQMVRALHAQGHSIDTHDPEDGTTPLYWAACNGHVALCNWLITHGANVNRMMTKSGSSALHAAADRGNTDCVFILIKSGANIDACTPKNWDTPLHLASYRGHTAVCRILVDKGAILNVENCQQRTPLQEAQTRGHYDLWHYLQKKLKEQTSTGVTQTKRQNTDDLTPFLKKVQTPPRTITGPVTYTSSFSRPKHQQPYEQDEGVDDVDCPSPCLPPEIEPCSVDTVQGPLMSPAVFIPHSPSSTTSQGRQFHTSSALNSEYITAIGQQKLRSGSNAKHSGPVENREQQTPDVVSLQKELNHLSDCIKTLHAEIKWKDERISHLEIINSQLKIYSQTYEDAYQELRQVRQELHEQTSRAEQAEDELNQLRKRIRVLQPKGQWLVDQWEKLTRSRSEETVIRDGVPYMDELVLPNGDGRHGNEWPPFSQHWESTYSTMSSQLTSRGPASDGESDHQDFTNKLLPVRRKFSNGRKQSKVLEEPISYPRATISKPAPELYHSLQPALKNLHPDVKKSLNDNLKVQLKQVSQVPHVHLDMEEWILGKDFVLDQEFNIEEPVIMTGDLNCKVNYILAHGQGFLLASEVIDALRTGPPKSNLGQAVQTLLQSLKFATKAPNLTHNKNVISTFIRHGIKESDQSLPPILSRDALPTTTKYYLIDHCPMTLRDSLMMSKAALISMSTKLREKRLVQMLLQVALGVEHLHANHYVHGNITLDTVMVDRKGVLKLACLESTRQMTSTEEDTQEIDKDSRSDRVDLVKLACSWAGLVDDSKQEPCSNGDSQSSLPIWLSPQLRAVLQMLNEDKFTLDEFIICLFMMLYGPDSHDVTSDFDSEVWLQAKLMKLLALPWKQINGSSDALPHNCYHLTLDDLETWILRTDVLLEKDVLLRMSEPSIWTGMELLQKCSSGNMEPQ